MALSRYHEEGLGGAEESAELSAKYLAFSESNPETYEEIQALEKWWESRGTAQILAGKRKDPPAPSNEGHSTSSNQRYYAIRDSQDDCISGDCDDEVVDMLYVFTNRDHAMTAARRAASEKNERYWAGHCPTELEEKANGWKQRGETSHRLFAVREIEVSGNNEESSANGWIWGVVTLQDLGLQGIDSLFVDKKKATDRFNTVVEKLLSEGPVEEEGGPGTCDILKVVADEPYNNVVKKESYLVRQINTDFDKADYDCYLGEDELREYIEDWTPRLDSIVQLVKLPILREPLLENEEVEWVKALGNPYAKALACNDWSDDDMSQVLATFEAFVKQNEED